jgi:HD-GYP domain-containing protein (c-di-GMP phosphodiesterase class II)
MVGVDAARGRGICVAEMLGVLSLAIDLGSGQPPGHGLRTCVLAVGLARELGLPDETVHDVHRVALLHFLGCTSDGAEMGRMVSGDDIAFRKAMAPAVMGGRRATFAQLVRPMAPDDHTLVRAKRVALALRDPRAQERSLAGHCELGAILAAGLGMSEGVRTSLAHAFERWDGRGLPSGLAGEEIPWPVRVVVVARDVEMLSRIAPDELPELLQTRRGRAYDPAVVDAYGRCGRELMAGLDESDSWHGALVADPTSAPMDEQHLDAALNVMAQFADLRLPWTRGHSARVAELAGTAAALVRKDAGTTALVRRAGLVHDLGQVGVPFGVWQRPSTLRLTDWERVRLHTLWGERALSAAPQLEPLGSLVGMHHERLDGSGYHRQLGETQLGMPARVLAAADVYVALREDRPHRPPLDRAAAAQALDEEARERRLDREAVDAVLAAAGETAPRAARSWPCGLSDREVDVLRRIARGRSNREVAEELHLSVKTVGRHVENVYAKIGVSSRAAAALFAMQERLLDPS